MNFNRNETPALRAADRLRPNAGHQLVRRGHGLSGSGTSAGLHAARPLEEGHADPWLILTDLPPDACAVYWYGLRMGIERGFKLTKRSGWQWQATRKTDPPRAGRLWLVVAVATLGLVRVGGEAKVEAAESAFDPLAIALPAQTHTSS